MAFLTTEMLLDGTCMCSLLSMAGVNIAFRFGEADDDITTVK